MSEEPSVGYGLVLPFVACQSKGGPYDDHAFVAGFSVGSFWTELEKGCTPEPAYFTPVLVPQLDLIAMHFGRVLSTEPWEDGATWVLVTVKP